GVDVGGPVVALGDGDDQVDRVRADALGPHRGEQRGRAQPGLAEVERVGRQHVALAEAERVGHDPARRLEVAAHDHLAGVDLDALLDREGDADVAAAPLDLVLDVDVAVAALLVLLPDALDVRGEARLGEDGAGPEQRPLAHALQILGRDLVVAGVADALDDRALALVDGEEDVEAAPELLGRDLGRRRAEVVHGLVGVAEPGLDAHFGEALAPVEGQDARDVLVELHRRQVAALLEQLEGAVDPALDDLVVELRRRERLVALEADAADRLLRPLVDVEQDLIVRPAVGALLRRREPGPVEEHDGREAAVALVGRADGLGRALRLVVVGRAGGVEGEDVAQPLLGLVVHALEADGQLLPLLDVDAEADRLAGPVWAGRRVVGEPDAHARVAELLVAVDERLPVLLELVVGEALAPAEGTELLREDVLDVGGLHGARARDADDADAVGRAAVDVDVELDLVRPLGL